MAFVPIRPLQPALRTHRIPDRQEVIEQQQVRPPRLPAVVQVELRHLPDRSPGNQGEQSNQQAHGIQVKRLQPGGKEPGERERLHSAAVQRRQGLMDMGIRASKPDRTGWINTSHPHFKHPWIQNHFLSTYYVLAPVLLMQSTVLRCTIRTTN